MPTANTAARPGSEKSGSETSGSETSGSEKHSSESSGPNLILRPTIEKRCGNITGMKKLSALVLLAICAAILLGASGEPKFPSMPAAVSGNAVASLKHGFELFSMMGVGPRKTWDDVTNQVYVMTLAGAKWHLGRPVPGVGGRLGASAAGAKNQIVLMGGYVLDAQGDEITVPDVNVYIEEGNWHRGQDISVHA